jgi:hypothetical protein
MQRSIVPRGVFLGAALAAAAFTLVIHDRPAHAIASSCRYEGWALAAGTKLPPHPHVVYYTDARSPMSQHPLALSAKIGGKAVPVKITYASAGPFELAQIEIDSDRTGALDLAWQEPKDGWSSRPPAALRLTIDKAVQIADKATGKTSRFHRAYHHSTVHESEDGLAVEVDVPAVAFKLHWRRDDKTDWQDLLLPATPGNPPVARIGEIGCVANFSVPMLEHGIDLELTAQLANGSAVKVKLPAHLALPRLPAGTDVSSP